MYVLLMVVLALSGVCGEPGTEPYAAWSLEHGLYLGEGRLETDLVYQDGEIVALEWESVSPICFTETQAGPYVSYVPLPDLYSGQVGGPVEDGQYLYPLEWAAWYSTYSEQVFLPIVVR